MDTSLHCMGRVYPINLHSRWYNWYINLQWFIYYIYIYMCVCIYIYICILCLLFWLDNSSNHLIKWKWFQNINWIWDSLLAASFWEIHDNWYLSVFNRYYIMHKYTCTCIQTINYSSAVVMATLVIIQFTTNEHTIDTTAGNILF